MACFWMWESFIKIFADDLKIIANSADTDTIENDLKNLEKWEKKWLLEFNIDGNQNLNYLLNGVEMKKSEQEKDLGVLTSGTLLWNDQINSCVSKANQMIC